jgi:preprotein translocase subunit YajC
MMRFKNAIRKLYPLTETSSLLEGFFFLSILIFTITIAKTAYAMGAGGGGNQQGGLAAFLPLILIVVVFYFLLIRPQTKKQKEHKMMLTTLRKGDKVVTNSGMFGTIVGMDDKENKVVLKVAENVKIEFLKSSIAGRMGAEE